MADNKPTAGDRKSSYISPLIIGVAVVAVGIIAFLQMPDDAPSPQAPPPAVKPAPPPAPPPVKPVAATAPLTRADLVEQASRAKSQFAAQGFLDDSSAALVGRRFTVSIAFGCGGLQNTPSASQLSVSYDAANRSITLSARPGVWTTLPFIQGLPDPAAIDAVEGFWIPRPWTSAQDCPAAANYPIPAIPTPPTAQTVGLAQLFPAGGSRVSRHTERPYEFTRKLPEGDTAMLADAYRMVLEGRITGFDKDHALRCWMESPYHQPVCVYAVTLDRVMFEDAATGKPIASWTD